MSKAKLNLFVRVYRRRLSSGETIEQIDASYPALTEEELNEIHNALN